MGFPPFHFILIYTIIGKPSHVYGYLMYDSRNSICDIYPQFDNMAFLGSMIEMSTPFLLSELNLGSEFFFIFSMNCQHVSFL